MGVIARPTLDLHGHRFLLAGEITARRTVDSAVQSENPSGRYKNLKSLPLNQYGKGPFGRFSIPALPSAAGLYALMMDDVVVYVGEAVDLRDRWGPRGYSVIHPRNCFKGGQETNCRINNKLFEAATESPSEKG
jgi:hypothetical protein